MIIGEVDQRLSNNYYETPPPLHQQPQEKFEVLKRKFSSDNENLNNFSDRSATVQYENHHQQKSNHKMHYTESGLNENYQTYQTVTEIHQDGSQSFINLTVMTPTTTMDQSNHQQQMIYTSNFHQHQQREITKTPSMVRAYQQQSDNVEDNEDKNLSWLFNFKLDDIANLSPEIKRKRTSTNHIENHQQHHQNYYNASVQQQTPQNSIYDDANQRKEPCIEDDLNVAENVVISTNSSYPSSSHTPKKPPFTYTELIEYALEDKGELTVSGIYQWISDRFPFYKSNDDRWKNSVRHNLSINPHFRKGNKAKAGAGHLWKISSRESEANFLAWEHKKQRLELFFKMEAANNLKHQNANRTDLMELNDQKDPENIEAQSYDAELNAATASIISLPLDATTPIITTHGDSDSPISGQQLFQYHEILPVTHQQSDDLRRTAGEILSGVRRNVEVQIMHPNELQSYSILNSEDYLNPISKEEIMQESGLGFRRHDEFYLIDSGINSTNADEATEIYEIFHEDFNLNYFGNNNIIA